tara:strand:+ start:14473 stop:14640 length:168 start_codon:yes stop_codon:yes gene_type:complete
VLDAACRQWWPAKWHGQAIWHRYCIARLEINFFPFLRGKIDSYDENFNVDSAEID